MSEERHAVLERLADLREEHQTPERAYQYVDSGHESNVSASDLLTVLRLDSDLALELRSSTGREVISAASDRSGEVRYAVWRHSAISGGRVRSWEHRRDMTSTLEGRRPLVRLRAETPLAGLEEPETFDRRDNAEVLE